jgi:hypothetical protein
MKVYLAGPMQGIPHWNYPAFHAAEKYLEGLGHEVFSPARFDTNRYGKDIAEGNEKGTIEWAEQNHGFKRNLALAEDLDWICRHAEMIAMLPGWEHSTGAFAEWATAKALGLKFLYI